MKTFTITALLGALVALPFVFSCRKPEIVPVKADNSYGDGDTNLRYDVDDFIVE